MHDTLAHYLTGVFQRPVAVMAVRRLGDPDGATADPKSFGYGVPLEIECTVGGSPRPSGAGAHPRRAGLWPAILVSESDPAFQHPTKPVGPTLAVPPSGAPAVPVPGGGWRRVVASPRPIAVVECEAIATLLGRCHVVAGGGGGIPVAGPAEARRPVPAVVDKDWVASLLAIALRAERLIFVTDVDAAYDQFDGEAPRRIEALSPGAARTRLAAGVFGPGSMAPKIESAADFVAATRRRAVITAPGSIDAALRGAVGTTIAA